MSTLYSRWPAVAGLLAALLLSSAFPGNVRAQANLYSRTVLSGLVYEQLDGSGVTILDDELDLSFSMSLDADDGAVLIDLPFTFTFAGADYSQATMCTNGWVGFGDQLGVTAGQGRAPNNLWTATVPNNLVAAWFGDGNANFPAPFPGSMRWGLVDTDVFRLQWDQNSGSTFNYSTTNLISFQVDLYGPGSAAPGRIVVQYGAATGSPSTGRSIGIAEGTAYLNGFNGLNNSTTNANAWPGNGTGYQFDPPLDCLDLSDLAAGSILDINFPCNESALITLNASGYTTGATGLFYQWFVSDDGVDFDPIDGATGVSLPNYAGANKFFAWGIFCPASDASDFTEILEVTVASSGPYDVPYSESFESLAPPLGTTIFPCGYTEANTTDWFSRTSPFVTGGGFSHIARTGINFITTNWSTGTGGDVMWTPEINLEAGTSYDASVWYATDGLSGWQSVNWLVLNPGDVFADAEDLGSAVANPINTSYNELRRSFIPSVDGTYRFGIRVVANSNPWQIAFDDISINFSPDCGPPAVSLASVNCGTGATFNASPGDGDFVQYEWELVPSGGAQGVDVIQSGSGEFPITLTGLSGSTTYRLYVRSECDGGLYSDYTFTNFTTGIVNDCSQDAIVLSSPCDAGQPAVTGSTIGSTVDADYVDAGTGGTPQTERGVWYILPGDNQSYTINSCAPISYDTRISVYTGTPGNFTPVVGNDDMDDPCPFGLFRSEVTFNAIAGTDYYIFIHGYQFGLNLSDVGNFQLNFYCSALCEPVPDNEDCATAMDLSPLSGSCSLIAVDNTCAAPATTAPSCVSQFGTYNDVWYSFVATDPSQALHLELDGTSPNMGIAVYGSCGGASLICATLTASGDYNIPNLTVGETYYVQLFTSASNAGSFSFCIYDGCPFPTTIAVSNATTESVTLSWNDNANAESWDIFYSPEGTVPTDATPPVLSGVTSNPIVITGLDPATSYTFWVRANCDENSASPWAGGVTGTTAPLPPACGETFVDAGGPLNYPNFENSITTICPDVPGEIVQVQFTSFSVENNWDYMQIFNGPEVTSPEITSSYTNPGFGLAPTGSWTGTLSPGTVTSTHPSGCLTFFFESDDIITAPGWNANVLCFDPCPSPTGVTVSNATASTLTLSWNDNAGAGNWDIFYSTEGDAPTGETLPVLTGVTDNPIVITGLTPGTSYTFWVRADCSEDYTSLWAGGITGTTLPPPPPCNPPVVSFASLACGPGAIFNVTPGAGIPVQYEWELVPAGGAQGVNVIQVGTSATSPITVTGLSGSTGYRLYVRTDCGGGVFSTYSSSNFTSGVINDCSSDAILLVSPCNDQQPAVTGTTIGATLDADYVDAGAGGTPLTERGVWYLLPGDDQSYTINSCAPISYDTRISVYTGSPGNFIPLVGNDDMDAPCAFGLFRSEVTFNALAGTDYYIFIHGYQFGTGLSTVGNFQLNFFCSSLCEPVPDNEDCASATDLSPLPGSCNLIAVDNTCAAPATTPPSCVSQFGTYSDVWYSFVATDPSQALHLELDGTSPNMGIAIYGSCGGASLICATLTSSGDYGIPNLTVGETYYVQLFTSSSNAGTFSFCIYDGCPFPTSITVSNATPESVTLSWNDNANAESWDIYYSSVGTVPTDATTPVLSGVTSNPIVITGLDPATSYTFWVRANCDENSASPWAGGVTGTTAPLPPACGETFVDAGGPLNYPNFENSITTICPDAPGQIVQVQFTSFSVENNWDYMQIFNGPAVTDPQITSGYVNPGFGFAPNGSWTGTLSPGTITSTHPSGCLTFFFSSDDIITAPGWNANVMCYGVTVDATNEDEYCMGDELIAAFTATGSFAGNNVFTLELSDENGSFDNPTSLGTLTGTTGSSIAAILPGGIIEGSGYTVRITTSNPATTSPAYSTDLFIKTTPIVSLGSDQDICDYETVMLSTGFTDAEHNWSNGADTESITVNEEATYSVVVTLDNGCAGTASVFVNVNESTPSSLPEEFELCPGDVGLIYAGDFATIIWITGEETNAIDVDQAGTYAFTAVNSFGCETTGSTEVVDAGIPEFNLGDDFALCGEQTLILSGPSGDYSYLWSDLSDQSTLEVSEPGFYSLLVTNDAGCSGYDEIEVLEGEVPVFELPALLTACAGEMVTINGPAGFVSYSWSTGETDESITVDESGTYYLSVSNEDGCESSAETEVMIYDLPVVDLGADITAIIGEMVTLDAGTGFATYEWSTGDDTQTITVDEGGEYTVFVTDDNGCSASDDINVTFVVSIYEVNGISYVVLYPNPANDFVRVDARLESVPATLRITDQSGRIVSQMQVFTFPVTIPVNQLAGGMYHLTLVQPDGSNHTTRLVIAH